MKRNAIRIVVVLAMLVAFGGLAQADEPPKVLQVVSVQVEPKDVSDYLAQLKRAQGILTRLGLPGFRVWQSTLAGSDTGSVVVAIESDHLGAFAANAGKLQADPEWRTWVETQQKSGKTKVVSNSMYVERTP